MGQENHIVKHFGLEDFLIFQENFPVKLLTNFPGYKPLHEE